MSTVLHPVGPEPPQTYWVRRAVVIGAAILVLIVLIAIVVSQNSNGSVVANPTPSPVLVTPSETAPPSPTASVTPTESADPTPTATGSTKSSEPESKTKGKASAKPSASPSPKKIEPVACAAGDLRATLTGEQKLKPKQSNTFAISLINGSATTCNLAVSGKNFELKIYSGKDRIWSSNDCTKSVKAVTKQLKSQQAIEWKMTWDGRRSKADCKERPEIPKAGTYFATAQFEGAKPIQLRMILRG